jgi:hypothetical protein
MAKKRWLCRLGLHRYQAKQAADGSRYEECQFCKKYREVADLDFTKGGF